MKRSVLAVLSILVLAMFTVAVQAQEALTDGEPVTGKITDEAFAVEYAYEGTADQVLVIELAPVDVLGDLSQPSIILRDPAGTELVRYDSYGATEVIWQLPETGTYTIVATRSDDAAGTSVGEFMLVARTAQELTLDTPVTDAVTTEETDYFVYRADGDFVLQYARTGDYGPEVTVNTINTDFSPGTLDTQATLGGKLATLGSIGNIPGGQVYVIRVGRALLDIYFDEVSADYAISVTAPAE